MTTPTRRPRTDAQWRRWVSDTLRTLQARRPAQVPVGGMVLWPTSGDVPPGWLVADGTTFDAGTDDSDAADEQGYPELADQLGATTLPHPTGVSGFVWLIRAD